MTDQPKYRFLVPTNMPGKPDEHLVEKPSEVIAIANSIGMYPGGEMGTAAGEIYNPNGTLMSMISVGTREDTPLIFQSVVMDPEHGRREISPNLPEVGDQFVDWNDDSVDYPVVCFAMEQTGFLEPSVREEVGRYFETFWYDPSVEVNACEITRSYELDSYGHFSDEQMDPELEQELSRALREDALYYHTTKVDRAPSEVKEVVFLDRSDYDDADAFREGVRDYLTGNPPMFGVETIEMTAERNSKPVNEADLDSLGL